jgi:putative acetyltransferase
MVREAREEDLDRLMEIWLSGNRRAHAFVDPSYWESHQETVRTALPQAEVLVDVQERTGAVRGFLGLSGTEVEGLFVAEAFCRRGIGTALVDAAKRRHPVLTLGVYEKNAPALAFYESQGFVPVREQTDPGTGEREIRMRWEKCSFPSPEG